MNKTKLILNGVFILVLLLPAMGGPGNALADGDPLKADPRLLQMAEENPDAVFKVIVQKAVKVKNSTETDPEADVENEGGKVKKHFTVIESFSAELTGRQILKLAKKKKVRWISVDAPMVSMAAGDPTVRDEFAKVAYSNNNGTQTWAGNWAETGDGSVSATSGYVKISSGQLQLSSTNRTLSRQANLSGVASATLTFQYKRSSFDGTSDYVVIQASANGGSTWTELGRFAGAGSDSSWQTASFNILSYAAANTQIRFATSPSLGKSDILYVDNVQIEYAIGEPPSPPPPAGTFVVNSTADGADANTSDGVCQTSTASQCTLRAAIQQANASTGANTITFNITGAGPHTIRPTSALPKITDVVIINGASEPDFAGTPIIELDGSLAGAGINGLTIEAGNSTIRGLVINRFSGDGIRLDINDNNIVAGNYIGTDVTGALDRGNLGSGILLYYQSGGNTIGGTTAADRNVISGNDYHGIFNQWSAANVIQGNIIGLDASGNAILPNGLSTQNTSGTGIYIQQADGNLIGGNAPGSGNIISGNLKDGVFASNSNNTTIQGNLIGTDLTGMQIRGNTNEGIFITGGTGTKIGGTASSERNVISGNGSDGIDFQSTNGLIQGNYIGTDKTGTTNLHNNHTGIKVNGYAGNNLIGGTVPGSGNLVAYNYEGIVVAGDTVTGNGVLGNSLHSNTSLGLNLGYDGVTTNNGSVGTGANSGMDYPVITSASVSGGILNVTGYVGSAANQSTFANTRVEFFKSSADSSGYGEGQTFVGYLTTDASGNFNGSLPGFGLVSGDQLTATATDSGNNTSEFGPNFQIPIIFSAFLPTTRADQLSLDGSGVTVAVIDSGINYHEDFTTANWNWRIMESMNFTSGNSDDKYGHGTHVAGIIAGNGAMSNGEYKGVAPGANLVSLKISDKDGMTYESTVVDALQWVYDNKDTYNIKVVNLSLNSTVAQSYHTSPLCAAVEILWFNGIVVVVSAGNNGNSNGSEPDILYPPANDPFVITVGATEDKGTGDLTDDTLAIFSAFGTTEDGFAKPDLVAPGRNLVAPLSDKASTVYTAHPLHRVGDYYFRMSGTSMSAPVVTGAVALLLQDEPNLNPDQVKYRLMVTANTTWSGYSASQSGAGHLDIFAAVNGTSTETANTGIFASQLLSTGSEPIIWGSAGWNSAGWNTAGWNSVGWNSAGWNSAGWNTAGWNSGIWDN
ncbi:MAG: S8 family serine peptidase [Anaerolineales bacterium]|nr:S8 family serine peptidase [Anaerolineales bacterium]